MTDRTETFDLTGKELALISRVLSDRSSNALCANFARETRELAEKMKLRSEAKIVDGKITCPHCRNNNLGAMRVGEWMVGQYRLNDFEDGILSVEADCDVEYDTAKDRHVFCDSCNEEFVIPDEIDEIFGD